MCREHAMSLPGLHLQCAESVDRPDRAGVPPRSDPFFLPETPINKYNASKENMTGMEGRLAGDEHPEEENCVESQ